MAALISIAGFSLGQAASPANVTAERLLHAASEPSQWMTYGGTYEEQRYSRLTQLNPQNVDRLGLLWYADYDTNLSQDGTPLYIDGVIYVSTAWSKVYAFEVATGRKLWEYDPKVPGQWAVNVCCGLVNRGIAAWHGRVYVGTLDGRLVAIDARTGKEAWSTLTIDRGHHYSITSAPRIAKGLVFIGNSGGEFGVRGYISAYDADTGKLVWRFYTVPGNPKDGFENDAMRRAAKTWGGEWWKLGGGGTVWDAIVYDPVTDLVYFGTGNGTPWNDADRDPTTGDDLYLASIVAVKAQTGEYVWHYQETPADTWDYDAVSPMMIANLKIDGHRRHVILQPSKNGFFYTVDAATGKLLGARPFTDVNWADGVDPESGRPRERPAARYPAGRPFDLAPGVQGAHGWEANAYSPQTGLMYVPTQRAYFPMIDDPKYVPSPMGYNLGIVFGTQFDYYRDHPQAKNGFVAYLQALDPVTGRVLWKGEPTHQGGTGGALATAGGLVFQSGGDSQEVRAYEARTGRKLWHFETQTGVNAPPITFEQAGRQYLAVSVGGNQREGYYAPNDSRLLVFALDGNAKLPPPKPFTRRPLAPPPATASPRLVKAGEDRYAHFCAACHGDRGQTRGANFPDLTRTPLLYTQLGFDQVVLKGALSERGMDSFASVLKPSDTEAIRAYIIARANDLKKHPPPAFGVSAPQPHEGAGQ
ncbi:MAG: PQQ-dependent dehydrogenase, methanol/ethanol family [Steroidobacteraceae bacterium]